MSQSDENKAFEEITVKLPAIYWTVILASLEETIKVIGPQLEELRNKKVNPESLSPEMRTAIVGPIYSRGVIVKAMVDHGHMKKEAIAGIGFDMITEVLQEHNAKRGGKKG